MRRRDFISLIGGASVAWPFAAHAQQPGQPRRISLLMLYPEKDPQGELRAKVFRQELEKKGWTVGQNLQIDFHWGTGGADWVRSAITQIVGQSPDVLLANGDAAVKAAQQATQTLPVIFIASGDPVGDGLVQSLAHPGRNLTGFAVMEPSLGAKLLGMLKQVALQVAHVGMLVNPDSITHRRIYESLLSAAPSFAVEVVKAPAREPDEIKAAVMQWGQTSDYGLIVPSDPLTNSQRGLIIELAARYRLPAIYALRAATVDGGLMSYGVDIPELFRQAGMYADRILKGEKPADLPVQLPTKFELVINLKTAKSLGITMPQALLVAADEVIE
jgi:putative tryptophan/tyrosine transport system substrate-binding protein